MSPLLLSLALAADPRLDAIEALNDQLETGFDGICAALKGGARTVAPALAKPGAFPVPQSLVWVSSCTLRALALEPTGATTRAVSLLFELEGRDATGARVIERGEADGRVRRQGASWPLEELQYRWRQTVRRESPRFLEVGGLVGLSFPPRSASRALPELLTGGLAVRDFDADGRLDFAAVDGATLYLFRNVPGGGRGYHFERSVLLEAPRHQLITSAAAGDFDNDGDADLAVIFFRHSPAVVLRNRGDGTFEPAGALDRGGRLQSALASDLDGDGNLDLVLLPYPLSAGVPSDLLEAQNGEPVRLYRGDGQLHFEPWRLPPGVAPGRWSLAAISADLLGLSRPQLYVANDFGSNDLYLFDADGGVRNVAREKGLDDPGNGMSADVADLDGDGRLDLYVANMFSKAGTRVVGNTVASAEKKARLEKFARGNTLYLSLPDGGFAERAAELGLNRGLWAFGSVMFDADDDGRLEVAVADGYYSDVKRKDL